MRRSLFLVCIVFFALTSISCARDATITDILVTNNRENVVLYAKLVNCFTKEMDAAILAGVPTTFTLIIDLYREHSSWLDEKINRKIVKQTVQYDRVKKNFYVSSAEGATATFQDFEGAKRAMAELSGIIVAPLKNIKRNEAFYIMFKAELGKVRLPLHMENVLFFVSLWDFETDWYRKGLFTDDAKKAD
jgi:hypothetical protein